MLINTSAATMTQTPVITDVRTLDIKGSIKGDFLESSFCKYISRAVKKFLQDNPQAIPQSEIPWNALDLSYTDIVEQILLGKSGLQTASVLAEFAQLAENREIVQDYVNPQAFGAYTHVNLDTGEILQAETHDPLNLSQSAIQEHVQAGELNSESAKWTMESLQQLIDALPTQTTVNIGSPAHSNIVNTPTNPANVEPTVVDTDTSTEALIGKILAGETIADTLIGKALTETALTNQFAVYQAMYQQAAALTKESAEWTAENMHKIATAVYMEDAAKTLQTPQTSTGPPNHAVLGNAITLEEARELLKTVTTRQNLELLLKASGSYEQLEGQLATTTSEPDSILKAWELLAMTAAKPEIQEKPAEFAQLLQSIEEFNSDSTTAKTQTDKSLNLETGDLTPKLEIPAQKPAVETLDEAHNEAKRPFSREVIRLSGEIHQKLAALKAGKTGSTTFEMVLNPAELGKITVKMIMDGKDAVIQIIAEKARTAALLQEASGKIRGNLELLAAIDKSDVKLESLTVEHKPDYNEQSDNRGNGKNQQGQGQQQNGEDSDSDENGISFADLLAAG
ncbi:MAG: flagellar hook-length control protein FliK [Oscillospiraceae bacterium]|nr:flagellar hook-length control protein FliK [Oscillospiraceae bacterium]